MPCINIHTRTHNKYHQYILSLKCNLIMFIKQAGTNWQILAYELIMEKGDHGSFLVSQHIKNI